MPRMSWTIRVIASIVAALICSAMAAQSPAGLAHAATAVSVAFTSTQSTATGDCGAVVAEEEAALPDSGGEITPSKCKGAETITGFKITKPTKLSLCGVQWTLAPGQTIAIESDFTLAGCNSTANTIRAAQGRKIFSPSGAKARHIEIYGVTLVGNGQGSQVIAFPDFERGAQDFSQGSYSIHDTVIREFGPGAFAIDFGKSTYMVEVANNVFDRNASGSIRAARDSEPKILNNTFWHPGGGPQIRLEGHSLAVVTGNDFERNGSASNDPDILFTPDRGGNTGYIWIAHNKFGPEGESATRYKIRVAPMDGDTVPRSAVNVYVSQNTFSCAAGQKAIRLESPILGWLVTGNFVNSCSALISDAQPLSSVAGDEQGGSILSGNRVLPDAAERSLQTCENGCRGFSVVEPLIGSGTAEVFNTAVPRQRETDRLQNRLRFSENFADGAWIKNGVTVTAEQKDPWGGTRAAKLQRSGAHDSESISQTFSGGSATKVYFATFWAKAESATSAVDSLYDATDRKFIEHAPIFLDSQWRQYTTVFRGAVPGHSMAWYLYPGGLKAAAASVTLCCVQVADQDSDYIPTSGQPVDLPGSGFRIQGAAHFAGDVNLRVPVVAKTTSYEIPGDDSNTCFVNSGAASEVVFTLPAPTAGFTACFLVDTSQAVTVRAHANSAIQMSGGGGTALSSSTPGSTVTILAISDSKWIVLNRQGNWSLR